MVKPTKLLKNNSINFKVKALVITRAFFIFQNNAGAAWIYLTYWIESIDCC
jgi:hypothetical protein